MLAAVEAAQKRGDAFGRLGDGEIAEVPDLVLRADGLVPACDERGIHRRHRREGPLIEVERRGMAEMRVAGEEEAHGAGSRADRWRRAVRLRAAPRLADSAQTCHHMRMMVGRSISDAQLAEALASVVEALPPGASHDERLQAAVNEVRRFLPELALEEAVEKARMLAVI